MLRAVRILGVIALALTLAACGSSGGSSGKAAYEHKMAAIAPSTQGQLLKRRFALEQARGPANALRLLRSTEDVLRRSIIEIKAIEAPPDVAAAQRDLIAGYRTELAELQALEPLARGASTDGLRVAAAKLDRSPGARQVSAALEAILAKGYDLGFPNET